MSADEAAVLEALEQIDLQWEQAANRGDAAGIASLYTDDGVLLPPNSEIVQGQANIQQALQAFIDAGMTNVDFTRVAAGTSGDLAYEIGRYSLDLRPQGAAPITDIGKYVIVARRQSDGTWRLIADIFNTSQPPAPPQR
ncbi:MAG TPA: SgcJ/EcaC family oxidoreductase [Gemmatimonadaceae bacterium]|nr:SgcJ/EcaC family oxidoreductase [Gemmatimonadaceae bacterium]